MDYCGGRKLKLDERTRYTEIANAIKATGRKDVRFNICRWAFPGTWAADIAGSRFEWHNRKSKQFTLLKGKGESRHPCCFTDDTVMTLAMADAILKWREGGDGSYSSLSVAAVKSMQAFGLLYPYAGYGGASHGNMRRTFRFGFCNGS